MLDRNTPYHGIRPRRRRSVGAWMVLPLALCTGSFGPRLEARPAVHPAAQESPDSADGLFLEQAGGLRTWALVSLSQGGPRPSRLDDRLDAMLESLVTAAACGVSADAWATAAPGLALREAAIAAAPAQRLTMLRTAGALANLAPDTEAERAMARCAVRLAESLLHTLDMPPLPGRAHPLEGLVQRRDVAAALDAARARIAGSPAVTPPFVQRSEQRLACFGIGGAVPRYVARDTAGNQVRSNDFNGKVTLYRIWDAASPASVRAHQRDAEFARGFWDGPFEVVGISSSDDRAEHLTVLDELGLTDMGTQLFDGPISTELVDALARSGGAARTSVSSSLDAWAQPEVGTCILVDSEGVIRARGLGHGELLQWIPALVNEQNLLRRERSFTAER